MGDRRPEPSHAVLLGRDLTQLVHGSGGNSSARDILRDPVSDGSDAVMNLVEIETSTYRAILIDKHVIGTGPRLLFGQLCGVLLVKTAEVLIAAIGNVSREVGAIRQFERQDCRCVIGSQSLQFGHVLIVISRLGALARVASRSDDLDPSRRRGDHLNEPTFTLFDRQFVHWPLVDVVSSTFLSSPIEGRPLAATPSHQPPRTDGRTSRRITQRHFATLRSRTKPKSAKSDSGPV